MITQFIESCRDYGRLFPLLSKLGLWKYVFICGFISLALGSSIFAGAYSFSSSLSDTLINFYPFDFGRSVIDAIAGFLAGSVLLLGGLFVYKYLILIVLSPVMSFVSEKMEQSLLQSYQAKPFSVAGVLSDFARGIRLSIRNISFELLIILGIFICTSFIPFVNIASTLLIFLVQAFYAGFGNMDFYLERHLGVGESIRFAKARRGMAMGNGAIFLLILLVPVLGWFLAPVLGAMAATLAVHPEIHGRNTKVLVEQTEFV